MVFETYRSVLILLFARSLFAREKLACVRRSDWTRDKSHQQPVGFFDTAFLYCKNLFLRCQAISHLVCDSVWFTIFNGKVNFGSSGKKVICVTHYLILPNIAIYCQIVCLTQSKRAFTLVAWIGFFLARCFFLDQSFSCFYILLFGRKYFWKVPCCLR